MSYAITPCRSCAEKAANAGTVGILPLVGLATQAAPSITKLVSGASGLLSLFHSNARSGGADPCCPHAGYDPNFPWPTNSSTDKYGTRLPGAPAAPPDIRVRGAPLESPSPSGKGRLKDDVCDCVPINVAGRYYIIGYVDANGVVHPGLPADSAAGPSAYPQFDTCVWVQVDGSGKIVAVPGVGNVEQQPAPSGAGTTTQVIPGTDGASPAAGASPDGGKILAGAAAAFVGLKLLAHVL